MTTNNGKDTIYIDIDDEITTIIEKVRGSNEKIVALVLPKRATVLQSIVNMKLLKRTADAAKKSMVLITSEAGLLPLAGTVGLYVAKTLQSKPEIPVVAGVDDTEEFAENLDANPEFTAENAGSRPVGELAGAAAVPIAGEEAIETLQLDDDADIADEPVTAADGNKPKKLKKDKKLVIPNFNKFRTRLFLLIPLLLLLIIGFYICASVLPKASLIISTDTSTVNSSLTLTADTAAKTLDVAKLILPAQIQKLDKTGSQQVPTTGKKNNGTRSSGSISMTAQECGTVQPANDVPAGTGVTSNGLTFITQENTSFNVTTVKNGCINFQASSPTTVTAQVGGANYNVSSATFKVAGRSDVSASGSTTGGTDNIIQVVSQSDIDSATQKITAQNSDTVKQQLQQQLQQAGEFALPATFVAGAPTVTPSAAVGDQVSTVSVTQTTNYTMFGVKQNDLKKVVDNDIKDKIDPSKQSILSEGLDKASFRVNNATATAAQLAMATVATAGPDLKVDTLKTAIAGKKTGDIQTLLKNDPGVTSVEVHFSPFWVTKAPSKPSKITITFQKAH